jgi:Tol biopolymer transport system component
MISLAGPARAGLPLLAALLVLSGCGGDSTGSPPPSALAVELAGRLERGGEATLRVTRDGADVDLATVQVTADPADAIAVAGPGRLRLVRNGSVRISVAQTDGAKGSVTVTVAAPPTVVFDRVADGNRDIWRVSLDGGELTRLTTDGTEDMDPSAAKGMVVFTSFRSGSADLWSVPLAGGTEKRLTTSAAAEMSPSLSPDGTRIAYTSDASGVAKLWTANADGSGAARATPVSFGFPGSIEAAPSWSPTAGRVVFVATNNGSADLFGLTIPGTPTLMVGGDSTDIEPAWSPDGTRVAFASRREGDLEIYLYTPATQTVARLTQRPGTDSQPAWLPDGRLVYMSLVSGVQRLFWLDPANPSVTHEIDTGPGAAQRPSGVYP